MQLDGWTQLPPILHPLDISPSQIRHHFVMDVHRAVPCQCAPRYFISSRLVSTRRGAGPSPYASIGEHISIALRSMYHSRGLAHSLENLLPTSYSDPPSQKSCDRNPCLKHPPIASTLSHPPPLARAKVFMNPYRMKNAMGNIYTSGVFYTSTS